ncbi:serine hydrolase [Haloimpatiens massiliensis]|uniref:serine hydrolase n=1 Tax=Haloimpatiens massiliensis TaxID=1658110 RepID=UPI000C829FF7|nr:serine hydrolase [Haloimpatiens massiliensis]
MKKKTIIIIILLVIIGGSSVRGVVVYKDNKTEKKVTEEKLLTKGKEMQVDNNDEKGVEKRILDEEKQKQERRKAIEEAKVILLRQGDSGQEVVEIQEKLYNIGYNLTVDGKYGNIMTKLIKCFQKENSLEETGMYNNETKRVLETKQDVRQCNKGYGKDDSYLEKDYEGLSIEEKIRKYLGKDIDKVGFVYYDLTSGEKISINENKACTAASTYKVGMNIVAYNRVRQGNLGLDEDLRYRSSMYESGTGILQNQIKTTLKKPISIQKLLDLSIIYSDNIATNMLSRRLGGVQAVRRDVCDITGIHIDTRKNVITPEMEFILLKELYEDRNEKYNAHLIDSMKSTVFHDRIDKYIPKDIVAHKIGNYGSSVNDVGIVFAEKPYIFVMYTDSLSNASNKIAILSKIVYKHHSAAR